MTRAWSLSGGVALLGAIWIGPLPALSQDSFAAHMTMHIAVVAIAAPLIAWGLAGSRFDPVGRAPRLFAPIPASIAELIVVWAWHAPALHQAARVRAGVFALEQISFLAAGLLLWLAALGGSAAARRWRAAAGIGAVLFTSIHMTMLGALFALTPRVLYAHHAAGDGAAALADQHLGGAIMLLVGGASYLFGGLWLLRDVLARPAAA